MHFCFNNVKIHYQVFGSGKEKILILPGWGDTACTFKEFIPFLEKDYQVFLVDYPSFGESPPLDEEWTIYDYANLFKAMIEELDINPYLVIGHSFGGRLAILLNTYCKVKVPKILLIDSAGILPKKTLKSYYRKICYKLLKKIALFLPKKKRQEYLSSLFSKYASSDYYNLPTTMRKTFQNIVKENLKPYLKKMTSQVLLIWGKNDLDTPLRDAKIMHKHIKSSELIIFERSGHFSYLENPYLTIKIILAFLDE